MSHSQSTSDIYRVNVSRSAERLKSRSTFPVEQELYELCNLSGVTLDSEVFQILLDLIQINVSPNALVQVLKKMTRQGNTKGSLENIAPSESGRSVTSSVSSRDGVESVFESATRTVAFREDTASGDGEKSNSERLANRLRALKGRKAT